MILGAESWWVRVPIGSLSDSLSGCLSGSLPPWLTPCGHSWGLGLVPRWVPWGRVLFLPNRGPGFWVHICPPGEAQSLALRIIEGFSSLPLCLPSVYRLRAFLASQPRGASPRRRLLGGAARRRSAMRCFHVRLRGFLARARARASRGSRERVLKQPRVCCLAWSSSSGYSGCLVSAPSQALGLRVVVGFSWPLPSAGPICPWLTSRRSWLSRRHLKQRGGACSALERGGLRSRLTQVRVPVLGWWGEGAGHGVIIYAGA